MRKKLLSILALLCLTVSSAWAQAQQTYTVTFSWLSDEHHNKTFNNATLQDNFDLNPNDIFETVDYVRELLEFSAYVAEGGGGKVSIVSSDINNLTIRITGAFEGTARIRCQSRIYYLADKEAGTYATASEEIYLYVTCVANTAVEAVSLPTTATLALGKTVTLTPTFTPSNATFKDVTWTTSDANVATVSSDGLVTAQGTGTATITVTATNGTEDTSDDKTATCQVTVESKWEGEGTAEKPYLIKNARQLKEMAAFFNANDPDIQGRYFRQGANIIFDKTVENDFTPISSFNGHYDGAGFTISGVNMNMTEGNNASLFGTMEGNSTVKNVIVAVSTFKGHNAAPIAGFTNSTASVENCHVLKDVTVEAITFNAGGVVANVYDGSTVKQSTSQAAVKGKVYAGGIAGYMVGGSILGCTYLGNSVACGEGQLAKGGAILGMNSAQGEKVNDCYFTAPTLKDDHAQLMPQYNKDIDNTDFLTRLAARDKFLTGVSGLTAKQMGYDITMNNRTTLSAVQKDDGTWQSKAYVVCLPFYVNFMEQLGTDVQGVLDFVEAYQARSIDLNKKELIFTNVPPELTPGGSYIVVVNKGSVSLTGKNVTVVDSPLEANKVMSADDMTKQIGEWKGSFKTIGNDEMIAQNVYIAQRNHTYQRQLKGKTGCWTNPFVGYFSSLEELASDRFAIKYVYTEQGCDEEGEVTDFPADEFDFDFEFDNETGIDTVESSKLKVQGSKIYDLQGRQLSNGQLPKGLYIQNGKKIVIK